MAGGAMQQVSARPMICTNQSTGRLFMYRCSRRGPPPVICRGLVEPPPRSAWWRAARRTAAAAGCCPWTPRPESAGGPWTCGRSGCGLSQSASRTSCMQTPGQPRPCVWSCGILVRLSDDTGNHKLHTCRRENLKFNLLFMYLKVKHSLRAVNIAMKLHINSDSRGRSHLKIFKWLVH